MSGKSEATISTHEAKALADAIFEVARGITPPPGEPKETVLLGFVLATARLAFEYGSDDPVATIRECLDALAGSVNFVHGEEPNA